MEYIDICYVVTPFLAWFIAGVAKFTINSIRSRCLAFDQIGYGGCPSNHSSIVASCVGIVFLKEGLDSPALVVSLSLAFIVILDANSLRLKVGQHATVINKLTGDCDKKLRERIGHSKVEIFFGVLTGFATALLVNFIFH
ncbi:divergent PAP2 family protein [Enterovibrio calviensis]|uniref:divergent PAP2 family protein n=1 Tax=Enterovibrio calviensis TaxID=91359 RepID=UPI003734F721